MKKQDSIYAIIYYLFYMTMIYLFGLLIFKTQIYENLSRSFNNQNFFRILFNIPMVVISALPIFIILKLRNQSIATVGLKKEGFRKAILTGIVAAIPFAALNMIGPISNGRSLNPSIMENLLAFLYYFICISFIEELAFRGFLQSRLRGLIENKWVNTIAVGIMFGLMHIPFQMLQADMGLMDFMLYDLGHLINTSIIHVYFVFLYNRDNNLLAPIVAHTIINFSHDIFI